jgi:hypothetical protein
LDARTPGLVRALDGGEVLDLRTQAQNITLPRRLYIQISSFVIFQQMATAFQTLKRRPEEQQQQQAVPCRCYAHFVSVFRDLEQYSNLVSM